MSSINEGILFQKPPIFLRWGISKKEYQALGIKDKNSRIYNMDIFQIVDRYSDDKLNELLIWSTPKVHKDDSGLLDEYQDTYQLLKSVLGEESNSELIDYSTSFGIPKHYKKIWDLDELNIEFRFNMLHDGPAIERFLHIIIL